MKKIFNSMGRELMLLMLIVSLFLSGFTEEAKADKYKAHRFKLGDSVVTYEVEDGDEAYIISSDSAGSGTDTHEVFITVKNTTDFTVQDIDVAAWLMKVNDTTEVSDFVSGTFLLASPIGIIPGASTTVMYKLIFQGATSIKVVRSNAANLTDISKVVIVSKKKAGTGGILKMPEPQFTKAENHYKLYAELFMKGDISLKEYISLIKGRDALAEMKNLRL